MFIIYRTIIFLHVFEFLNKKERHFPMHLVLYISIVQLAILFVAAC